MTKFIDDNMSLDEMRVRSFNQDEGDLNDGFNCPICRNKGKVMYLDGNRAFVADCECMSRRNAIRAVKRCGADDLLKIHSFKTYAHSEKWQDTIFLKAKAFAEKNAGLWFVGGQIGSGKTKISIAVLNRLLERGKESRYYIWQNLLAELTRLKMEDYGRTYDDKMLELIKMPVLYIDDFLRNNPTDNEIKIAYDLINARYMKTLGGASLITLISSQRHIANILQLDEAIGSRICEVGGEYIIDIADGESRNYRMKIAREMARKAKV